MAQFINKHVGPAALHLHVGLGKSEHSFTVIKGGNTTDYVGLQSAVELTQHKLSTMPVIEARLTDEDTEGSEKDFPVPVFPPPVQGMGTEGAPSTHTLNERNDY